MTILWSQSSLFLSKANALFYLYNVLSSENLFRNQRFKKSEFFCEHDLNLPVIIMLIFLNILLAVIFYWLIFKRGCLLIAYVRDLVTECVFFPGIIPLGPVVPYQQCIVLFGVDHVCLTRHSVGTPSHHLSCRLLLLVEGVPSTIWDTDVERIDRTSGAGRGGRVLRACLHGWLWQLLAMGKLGWKGSKHWDTETCWNERAFRKSSIVAHERFTWDTLHSSQQQRARRPCGIGRNEARAAFPQLSPWICQAEARSVAAFCCQSSQAALLVFWILTVSFDHAA